jgi:hypothetical protein
MFGHILALALLACAAPAWAQSGTVTSDASGYAYFSLSIPSGPGHFSLTFKFSEPGTGMLTIHSEQHYNFYFIDTGQYFGGDDVPTYAATEFTAPVTSGRVYWKILPPYSIPDGNVREDGFYEGIEAMFDFQFSPDTSIAYAVSIAQVPEPGGWAFLICGAGVAGVVLRGRRRYEERSAAPLVPLHH